MANVIFDTEAVRQASTGAQIAKMAAKTAGSAVGSSYKTQENDFYTMQQKAKKTAAMASLPATAFYKLKKANEHSVTNIDLDNSYLEKIGFDASKTKGISAQKAQDYTNELHANAESNFQSRIEDKYFQKFDRTSHQTKLESLDQIESKLHNDLFNAKRAGNAGLEANIKSQISAVRETRTALNTEITVTGKSTVSKMTGADKMMTNARHYGIQSIRRELIGAENDHSFSQVETGGRMAHKAADLTVKINHKAMAGSIDRQIAAINKQLVATPHDQKLLAKLDILKTRKASLETAYQRYNKVSNILRGDFKLKKDVVKTGTANAAKAGSATAPKTATSKAAENAAEKAAARRAPKLRKQKGVNKRKPNAKFSKKGVAKTYKKAANRAGKDAAKNAAKNAAADAAKKNRWKDFFSRWGKKFSNAAKGSAVKAGGAAAAKGAAAKGGSAAVASSPVGWIIGIVALIICFIFGLVVITGGTVPIFLHYMSADISTDFGGAFDEGVNYCQAITNLVTYDLAAEMDLIQKTSAYDELTNKAFVGRMGIPAIPRDREENSIYVWEEVDNKTTWLDKDGKSTGVKIYADTYIADASKRNSVTPYDNIVPIMNMMHMKMQDEIDYDSWHQALAYVYYMFAMSHNVNLYDAGTDTAHYLYLYQTNGEYSGYRLKRTYDGHYIYYHQTSYEEGLHAHIGTPYYQNGTIHTKVKIEVNPDTGTPIKYGLDVNTDGCTNEFFHDGENGGVYSAARIANLFQLRKIYGKRFEYTSNKAIMKYFNNTVLKAYCGGDPKDRIYTNAENKLKKMGFVVANEQGNSTYERFAFIATEGNGDPDWAGILSLSRLSDGVPYTGTAENEFIDNYANKKGTSIEAYQTSEQHDYGEEHWKVCNHYVTVGGSPDDIYNKDEHGNIKYTPYNGNTSDLRKTLNTVDFTWYFEKVENRATFEAEHRAEIDSGAIITVSLDGLGSFQGEYVNYNPTTNRHEASHFAWTYCGYAVCLGHCGGHVYPTMDLIEMMTYEGLAQLDGFKTTKGESFESIVGPNVIAAAAQKLGVIYKKEDIQRVNEIIRNENHDHSAAEILTASADANAMEINAVAALDEPLINSGNMREWLKARYIKSEMKDGDDSQSVSFLEWRAYWNSQAKRWFSIFPSSPKGLLQNISRKVLYAAANITDWATSKLNQFKNAVIGLFGGDVENPTDEEEDIGVIDENNEIEDAFDFTGWFEEDGSGYDEDAMSELYDYYGGFYEDGFETSLELWDSFEVKFDERYIKLKDKDIKVPTNYEPKN